MMLTRCPACQTIFRLGPEQLHARRGEVRCGHCFHPFNALEHEVGQHGAISPTVPPPSPVARSTPETPPAAASEARRPPPASLAPEAPRPAQTPSAAPDFFVLEEKLPPARAHSIAPDLDFEIPDDFPPFEPEPAPTPSPAITAPTPEVGAPTTAVLPDVVRSGRRPAVESPSTSSTESRASAAVTPPQPTPKAEPEPEPRPTLDQQAPISRTRAPTLEDLDLGEFERTPKASKPAEIKPAYIDTDQLDARYGRPRKPASLAGQVLTGIGTGLLGCLLVLQCVYLYRVEIARTLPGLRPLLSEACRTLGCDMPYPRDAKQIGLDASDLQSEPGKPGQYVLHATVNNRASYPQDWPHMELTLTDARETPIARRVLTPDEWIPQDQHRDAFASRNAVNAKVPFSAPDLAPTGYRVYIFYP